jgi:hypothetical protein
VNKNLKEQKGTTMIRNKGNIRIASRFMRYL